MLPVTKAKMSANQVTTNSSSVQLSPASSNRSQIRAMQAGAI
jgi:hypothetical protein